MKGVSKGFRAALKLAIGDEGDLAGGWRRAAWVTRGLIAAGGIGAHLLTQTLASALLAYLLTFPLVFLMLDELLSHEDQYHWDLADLWRTPVARPDPAPGEYFSDLDRELGLDQRQEQVLADLRDLLVALKPAFAPESFTNGKKLSRSDPGESKLGNELVLAISHSEAPGYRIEVSVLVLTEVTGPYFKKSLLDEDWEADGARIVAALVSGRNRQVMQSRRGRVVSARTELWDTEGWEMSVKWQPLRTLPFRLLPFPSETHERSISFDAPLPRLERWLYAEHETPYWDRIAERGEVLRQFKRGIRSRDG